MDSRSFREKINTLYRNKEKDWDIYGDRQIDPNELTHEDITYLLTRIRNCNITILCLANLDLTDTQLLPIIKTLESDTNITTLMLPFNQISDKGARAIAELLKKNTVIKQLILFRNKITAVGMREIAAALKENKTLVKMEFFDNAFSVEEIMPLFRVAMAMHPRLETIMLSPSQTLINTHIKDEKRSRLKKLHTMYFTHDPASPTSKSTLPLLRK